MASLLKPVTAQWNLAIAAERPHPPLPFRLVNRRDVIGYRAGLQRHHILPVQLRAMSCFARLFSALGDAGLGFDDFRRNGILLPASEEAAIVMTLPLHRGPHRGYNAVVIERVGAIERGWAMRRWRDPYRAGHEALFRLELLQSALRRRLLDPCRRVTLNQGDPASRASAFVDMDAMAETLWA